MVPASAAVILSACWVAGLTLAPFVLAHVDTDRLLYTASAVLYGATSWICHQRPDRSFHLEGIQLPVCARCFGAYLGASLGVCAPWWKLSGDLQRWRRLLVATGGIVGLTYLVEWGGGPPGNAVRAVTAIPFGTIAGALVVAVAHRQVR